jgi:hypothetical protein
MLRRTLRVARNLFLMVIALCIALLVIIRIEQRMMRANAERLYSEIMSLELLKTPGGDAVRTFSRWGNAVQTTGNCGAGNCALKIQIFDWMARHKRLVQNRWLFEHYPMIGGRNMAYGAKVTIVNGVLVKKGFSLLVVNITAPDESGRRYEQERAGAVQSVSNFSGGQVSRCDLLMQNHPEYCVTSPYECTKCVSIEALFTPFAPENDVARISQFNFDCMTRWSPCKHIKDILPAAAAEYEAESAKTEGLSTDARGELSQWRSKTPWINARELESVVIAEVVSIGTRRFNSGPGQKPGDEYPGASLKLVEKLKGAADWNPDEFKDLYIRKKFLIGPPETYAMLKPGARFIVMYQHAYVGDPLESYQNAVFPLNDVNLAQVKFGISRDTDAAIPANLRPY